MKIRRRVPLRRPDTVCLGLSREEDEKQSIEQWKKFEQEYIEMYGNEALEEELKRHGWKKLS